MIEVLAAAAGPPGDALPAWSAIPFLGLLLAIALFPLFAPGWWHSNRHRALVSFSFGIPVAIFVAFRDPGALLHAGLEYLSFISLLGSLYIISGNVCVRGTLPGTPAGNTLLLAAGALCANLTGTTGASMLFIRPFLKANAGRRSKVHLVVFFILIVANCGGCLTPLGDPPLFLGLLKGVPFPWTLGLWKEWGLVVGGLLLLFILVDRSRSDAGLPPSPTEAIRIDGKFNLLLLLGVVGIVLVSGLWIHPRFGESTAQIAQSAALTVLSLVSLLSTPAALRKENEFSWHPLLEVVILFLGIFATMIPALSILRIQGPGLDIHKPWQFFAATGFLSAFLDNAPTYLAFLSLAQHLPDEVAGTSDAVLRAISCGAVFFGALTYIGNGPNFMIKAIAEHSGIRMPSFFGYLGWSSLALGPFLLAVAWIFF